MSPACSASMWRRCCPMALRGTIIARQVADVMIDLVNSHAPNFKASVLGRQIMSPLDLERTFGLIGGDIFHGALSLDQLFSARPMLGHGDYRGPLQGLYMCGSGTHPGGGVTGAPGHNAAREIIADFRRRRLTRAGYGGAPASRDRPRTIDLPVTGIGVGLIAADPAIDDAGERRADHRARPRTARAATAPSRRRTAPDRCCAPDSPRCWSPGC